MRGFALSRRAVHVLNGTLVLALLGGSALAWPGLPAEIPIHFGPTGEPDRWADTTFLSWFGLPALGVVLGLALYLLGALLPARPGWLAVPDRKRFRSLPPEARTPVYRRVRTILHLAASFLLVVFGLLQLAVYREAHGSVGRAYVVAVLAVAVGGSPVLSAFAIVGTQKALDEAWRRARREGEGSHGRR